MKNIRRILLVVAYDGTSYSGWAAQKSTPNTIEEMLNRAVYGLTGERVQVIGASRTDAGVHAYGNIAVFDTASTVPGDRFSFALNNILPHDIRVVESKEVATDFHPRHCDTLKTYEYRILNTKFEIPTERFYTYHFNMPLDEEAMDSAAKLLEGEHDFTSFCSAESQALSHVRTITHAAARRDGEKVIISVTGNGFLYNMVRIIAGTLIQVGRGKLSPADIPAILAKEDRVAAGPTAPACGLFLMKYEFAGGIPEKEL